MYVLRVLSLSNCQMQLSSSIRIVLISRELALSSVAQTHTPGTTHANLTGATRFTTLPCALFCTCKAQRAPTPLCRAFSLSLSLTQETQLDQNHHPFIRYRALAQCLVEHCLSKLGLADASDLSIAVPLEHGSSPSFGLSITTSTTTSSSTTTTTASGSGLLDSPRTPSPSKTRSSSVYYGATAADAAPSTPKNGVSHVEYSPVVTRKRLFVACLALVLHIESNSGRNLTTNQISLAFDVALAVIMQSQAAPVLAW